MPPKIEKNIIAPAETPKVLSGQPADGPQLNEQGSYMPAEYKTARGNTRQDR